MLVSTFMRHARGFLVSAAVAFMAASRLEAQENKPVSCNFKLWQPHIDNPVDHTHYYTMPRIAWDVAYPLASLGIAKIIEKTTSLSPKVSAWIPTIGIGVLPHVVGRIEGRYPISIHMAFTAVNRSAPLVFAAKDKKKAAIIYAAANLALIACDR
jgi:hypothetical protein